jgi:TPP-dependent pyruvate/acetoin dehydrogenase alpha subunit
LLKDYSKGGKEVIVPLDDSMLIEMLEKMMTIRYFEEQVAETYKKGLMHGLAHLYPGEEAVAVGVCSCLEREDYITSTHRGHGHLIAKGGNLKYMMAEIMGKREGYCKGKGGSMHIAEFDLGILGANGIVGGGFAVAVGAGLSSKILGQGRVAVCSSAMERVIRVRFMNL